MDDKAAAAGSDIGELNGRGVVCCAKDDIGAAGRRSIGISSMGTNNQISESITIDVASGADGSAAAVAF